MRVLATLLKPDAGWARVAGYDVVKQANALRSVIGLAGQFAAVDENLTGRENLELVGHLYHLTKPVRHTRAQEVLELFDLAEAGNRLVKTYSGGMRRRLDVGASLVARPPSSYWTSRPRGWTRAPASTCGSSSRGWSPTGPPCY